MHFKSKFPQSEQAQQFMAYGTENEKHAQFTLVALVLPQLAVFEGLSFMKKVNRNSNVSVRFMSIKCTFS